MILLQHQKEESNMEGHLNWGLPLIIDLFAAGMGAGALMVAVAADFEPWP